MSAPAPDDLAKKLAALSPEARAKLKATLLARKQAAQGAGPAPTSAPGSSIPMAPEAADYPLSHAQQRLAVIQSLAESSRAYHLGGAFVVAGGFDAAGVERALRQVVVRHESLRTQFREVAEKTRQVIQPPEQWTGFTLLAPSDRETFTRAARRHLDVPLDLARDALFSVQVGALTDGGWGIVFKLHHIIADGVSMGVLLADVAAAYAGRSLVALPRQPKDFAVWSLAEMESDRMAAHRRYWQERFATLPEPLALNTDRPRPAVQDPSGAHHYATLPLELVQRVEALGQTAGATAFMTWLATMHAVLARWARQSDLVIGCPVAGRERPEWTGQIGLFVNTLPLRVTVDPSAPFVALLGAVREAVAGGVAHQAYPFDRLVDDLALARDLGRSPLFDAMLGYEEDQGGGRRVFDQPAEELPLENPTSKVDLTFHLTRTPDGLRLDLEYATALFDARRMQRLAESWREWLENLVTAPERALGDHGILSARERQRVLWEFNAAAQTDYPRDADLVSLWREQVIQTPEAIAVQQSDETWTYRDLDAASEGLAHHLAVEAGLQAEEPVALMVERSPRMLVALLGVLKAGGAYLPINPDTPAERTATMLADAGCRLVVNDTGAALPDAPDGARVLGLVAAAEFAAPVGWTSPVRTARSLTYLIFTSGSTGQPKGTLVEDRAVVRLVCQTNYAPLEHGARILQTGALAFDASTFEIWGALLNGGCLCLPRGGELLEITAMGELVRAHQADTLFLTTGLFNQVVEFAPEAFAGLKTLLTGGEKVSLVRMNALRQRYPDLNLVHVYGPTENTTFSSFHRVERSYDHDVPIGGPIAHSTLYILDDRGHPVPPGVTGEVFCGGDGLARGYLNRPALTAEKFVPHPYGAGEGERLYATGDLGTWTEEGQVVFIGRNDDQVKIRGFRVELGEIETALRALAGVQQAVVVARPQGGTHELVGYVVGSDAVTVGGLRDGLAASLPAYMVPAHWVMLEALPLNANGKVDRRRLPAPEAAGAAVATDAGESEGPGDALEREIYDIWRAVLAVAGCAREANFFSLGGDSIKAIQLVARLRQRRFQLKLTDVFAQPSWGALARLLAERPRDAGETLPQGPVVGPAAMTPVQRWFLAQFIAPHDRFCQTTLLRLPEAVNGSALRAAIGDLYRHHDALRAAVAKVDGVWQQTVGDPERTEWVWAEETLTSEADLEGASERLLQQISLAEGRLLGGGWYRLPDGDRLFLAIHHWAVDGLSWRVLAEDLQAAYAARVEGIAVGLPTKTGGTGAWSERVTAWAEGESVASARQFWRQQAAKAEAASAGWRTTVGARSRSPKQTAVARWTLAGLWSAETHRAYRSEPRDLLLAAWVRAWAAWRQESTVALTLEGHGREAMGSVPPIERTVGWFTSLFPVVLANDADDVGRLVRGVRTALGALPQRGASYLPLVDPAGERLPAVSFNYLGAFSAVGEAAAWTPVEAETAPAVAPHLGGPFAVDVVVTREGDAVDVRLFHDPGVLPALEAEHWLAVYRAALAEVVTHCAAQREVQLSPPDFSLSEIGIEEMDTLVAANGRAVAAVRDLLPLGSMQAGLLYQYLRDPAGAAYRDLVALRVQGPIERAAFDRAWQQLLTRHANLTARFWHQGWREPVQVVLAEDAPLPTWHEASKETVVELRERLGAEPFNLAEAGPLRLDVVKLGATEHEWIIRFHHIALDGWSSGLLMQELSEWYAAEVGPAEPPRAPRRTFVQHLAAQRAADPAAARAYWAELLQGAPEPAEVPPAVARLAVADEAPRSVSVIHELSGADHARLVAFAGDEGVSVSAVLQTAWALVLGQWNRRRDVVYGVTVSGREGTTAGIEEVVGLLINTLPLRVRWTEGDTVIDLLRQVHRQAAASQEHAAVDLAELQAAGEQEGELFTHSLIFENYPEQAEAWTFVDAAGETQRWATEVVAVEDPMHFEFGLLVAPGTDALRLRAVVDARLHPASQVKERLQDLVAVLLAMVDRPHERLSALPVAGGTRVTPIDVSATFTADPILPVLRFWGRSLSLPVTARCGGFNQVFQELLSAPPTAGWRVVLVRPADWLPESEISEEAVEPLGDELVDALRAAVGRGLAEHYLVVWCPGAGDAVTAGLRRRLARRLEALAAVDFVDGTELARRYGIEDWADARGDALGGVPYQETYYAALGTAVMRRLDRQARPPLKVVATDADETLWAGIVGEDGLAELTVPPTMVALQERLAELARAGTLLALCSKNVEADVAAVLAQHPDMRLRRDDFVLLKANWQPKPGNVAEAAAELGLGLDSFAFLDDNPVEVGAMRAELPVVRTVQAPGSAAEQGVTFWAHQWLLDGGAATAEDRDRTRKYREHAERESVRRSSGSLASFVATLELELDFLDPSVDWERAAQLTLRTNQFHAAPRRCSAEELCRRDGSGLLVAVRDRFGDYGRCGLALWSVEGGVATVETFLLSCRALGRGVEHAMLREVAARTEAAGATTLEIRFVRTAKNEPVAGFLSGLGAEERAQDDGARGYRLSTEAARQVQLAEGVGERVASGPSVMPSKADRSGSGRLYEIIAGRLNSGSAIAEAVRTAQPMRRRRGPVPTYVAPEGAVEETLVEIWAEVLGLPRSDIGVTSDFFTMGGQSLKAVQVLSRMAVQLGTQVSLEAFLSGPTVRELAAQGGTRSGLALAVQAAPKAESYPLSRVQRRFWILEEARGAGPSPFHMAAVFVIEGAFEAAALEEALAGLVARHEGLRTVFRLVDGEPRQIVLPEVATPLWIDETALPDSAWAEEAGAWTQRPFDLGRAPLLRVRLQRLEGGAWGLAIVMHHMIGDGWSVALMARELSAAYGGEAVVAPRLQPKDLAWHEAHEAAGGEDDRLFWQQRLEVLPEPLVLPADRPRPAIKQTRGGRVEAAVPAAVWQPVVAEARAVGASAFGAALAVLRVFVARYAGATEVVIGTPVAGRDRAETEDVVGCLVNLLPLRGAVDLAEDFMSLLATTAADLRGALSHQRYPFDALVQEVAPERDPARAPLFDVMLAYQNAGDTDFSFGQAQVRPVVAPTASSQYDWTLNCFEEAGGLVVSWEYDTALFNGERMERVARGWESLVAALGANPRQPVGEVAWLPAAEQAQLLAWGRKVAACTARVATIPRLVEAMVQTRGDRVAVRDAAGTLTYVELGERVTAAAGRLAAGEAVGVSGPRNRDWIVAQLAVMRAGGIYVPLDPAYPEARLQAMATVSGLRRVLWTAAEEPVPAAVQALGEVVTLAGLGEAEAKALPEVDPAQVAYMIFTSGSTGVPKGVEVEHRAFATMIVEQVKAFGVEASMVAGQFASMAFDASLSEVFLALTCGAELSLAPEATKRDLAALASWLRDDAVELVTLPPALVGVLEPEVLAGVKTLITAGERADPAVVERYRGRLRYLNGYGPTETAVCTSCHDVFAAGESEATEVPIGRPLPCTAVRVLDDQGQLAPIGVTGELGVMGPTLARGYRGQRELTEAAFGSWNDPAEGPQRLYRTGDLVRWNARGELVFLGRRDAQVKLRGYRIELGEIEAAARAVAGVEDALARVWPDPERLVLWVRGDATAVLAALREQLPAYMVPAQVLAVEAWPLSANGKVDVAKLPVPDAVAGEAKVLPLQTDAERVVAEVWRRHLGGGEPHGGTDFFAQGGDSIRALQVIAMLRERGWSVNLGELFQAPRLAAFAGRLRRVEVTEAPADESSSGRLSPIQQWFFAAHPDAPWAQFNQGIVLELATDLDEARLARAWAQVVARQPMLRSRFERDAEGAWRRCVDEKGAVFPTRRVRTDEAVDAVVRAQQSRFDLARGPLVQSLWIEGAVETRVVLLAHHLIIDWVSWRLLLRAWADAYAADPDDGPVVDAYGRWVDGLHDWAVAPERDGMAARWREQQAAVAAVAAPWPREAWGSYGEVAGAGATMKAPAVAGAALRNLILAGLWRVLAQELAVATLTVELESHGRGLTPDGQGVESVVGWFTALYPVVLESPEEEENLAGTVERVAAAVDADPELAVAALALGAYRPELGAKADCAVGFNFLGSFDSGEEDDAALWRLAEDEVPEAIAPDFPRDHALDVTAFVMGGKLQLRLAAPPAVMPARRLQQVAEAVIRELREAGEF